MTAMRHGEIFSCSSQSCYHVYLSFNYYDACKKFVDKLYRALMQAGILTFPDCDKPGGRSIVSEMRKAIKDSKISIVIFSEQFAYSRWCLDELVNILERKRTAGHMVFPVFYKVDPSHIRHHRGNCEKALIKLEQEIVAETREQNDQSISRVEKWKLCLTEAANLAGTVFDVGDEEAFIEKIIHKMWNKLSRSVLSVARYSVGIYPRVKDIILWVQDSSLDTCFSVIYGESGIGKTTIVKAVYDLYSGRFDACCFISNLGEIEQGMNGYSKIEEAFRNQKFLVVVDDVDHSEQFDVLFRMQHCFLPGSKLIVVTRNERLTRDNRNCLVFNVSKLNDDESLQLFCWHVFGHEHSMKDYMEHSNKFISSCGGLPLALQVLGSSLRDAPMDQWEDTLSKLENEHDPCIQHVLKVGYESLQDDHEKNLFLEIACFFIGEDTDYTINILDECGYYTPTGIQNLVDRCLLTIAQDKKLRMHHLLQEMAKYVIIQESLGALGNRTRIWHSEDALTILQEETGTEYIEGFNLKLDPGHLLSTSQGGLTTDAFTKMRELRILHLKNVHLHGSYRKLPKKIKWLCWDAFQLHSIPSGFPLENVALLEMQNSNLKQIWKETKCLMSLKTLNLSHSHSLTVTPDFSGLSNLERLIFEDCINLIEIHNSIGNLQRLLLLDLKGCVSLRKLPRVIEKLKSLEILLLSGCLKLEFTMIKGKMLLKIENWMSPGKSKNVANNSLLNVLPHTLVRLDLSDCNLMEKGMPSDLSILSSLEHLNLSRNPISVLPKSIIGLTALESLELVGCGQLQSLPELPSSLKMLNACSCRSLEKITNLPNFLVSLELHLEDCGKLVEVEGLFKMRPIRNVEEMLSKWGIIDCNHSELTYVELVNCLTFTKSKYPLMALHEFGIFSTFIPGGKVPGFFKKTSTGEAIHIDVPCVSHASKYWVDICVIYETATGTRRPNAENCITIKDQTKKMKWTYSPVFYAVKGSTDSILWLTRWDFGNQLEGGDQIVISINMNFQVKEVGVNFFSDAPELDTYLRTSEEEDIEWPQHVLVSGQHDVSHLSVYQPNKGVYLLSHHP